MPGPEVLRGEILAGDLVEVRVHVLRADRPGDAVVVEVLEEVLSGELLQPRDHPREPPVAKVDLVVLPALSTEPEDQAGSLDVHVLRAQRGQAVRLVRLGVLSVPDADERFLEQPHGRGHDLLARDPRTREVGGNPGAQARKGFGEIRELAVLRFVADLAPSRVIAVLLAASRIAPGRLDVAERAR